MRIAKRDREIVASWGKRERAAILKIAKGNGYPIRIGSDDTRYYIADYITEWQKDTYSVREHCTLTDKGRLIAYWLKGGKL